MKTNYFPLFLEGDDDNAGGGTRSAVASILPPVGEEPQHEPNNEPGGDDDEPEPEPESKPTSLTIDPDSLATALAKAGLTGQPAAPRQTNKSMTPEEIAEARKALKFWDPDEQFFTKFNNMETQKEALLAMRDGMTEQFAAMMAAYIGDQRKQIEGQFTPLQQFYQEQQAKQDREAFTQTYEQFSDPKFDDLRTYVMEGLVKAGKKFDDVASAHKAIAKGMEAFIQTQNPEFKLSVGSNPTKKPNPNAIKPAPKGGGGGGGGGNNSSAAPEVPTAVKFLPKVR